MCIRDSGYSIFAAVLGMLQFGYNTGVINAPESVSKVPDRFITFESIRLADKFKILRSYLVSIIILKIVIKPRVFVLYSVLTYLTIFSNFDKSTTM